MKSISLAAKTEMSQMAWEVLEATDDHDLSDTWWAIWYDMMGEDLVGLAKSYEGEKMRGHATNIWGTQSLYVNHIHGEFNAR